MLPRKAPWGPCLLYTSYLSRTGLNGAYKTKKPIGGLFFSLHFEYNKDGGLRAVACYSSTKAGKDEYDTRLKSLYKRMLNGLTGLYLSLIHISASARPF